MSPLCGLIYRLKHFNDTGSSFATIYWLLHYQALILRTILRPLAGSQFIEALTFALVGTHMLKVKTTFIIS